jgi:hypothetical protein
VPSMGGTSFPPTQQDIAYSDRRHNHPLWVMFRRRAICVVVVLVCSALRNDCAPSAERTARFCVGVVDVSYSWLVFGGVLWSGSVSERDVIGVKRIAVAMDNKRALNIVRSEL